MCGIVGIISHEPVSDRLIRGLKELEYRGYDSAGIATLVKGNIHLRRAQGKLKALQTLVKEKPLQGNLGIGHTRWATHGVPSEDNAHPHMNDHVAVVHNGIIENFAHIKNELSQKGHIFKSQTDTEVIVHLLSDFLSQGLSPLESLRKTLSQLKGAFALAIIFENYDNLILVARRGSPLVIGHGDKETTLGSDALVLAPWTKRLTYLEDGDYAVLTSTSVEIYDEFHLKVDRPIRQSNLSAVSTGKGEYRHYMLKEIYEQPTTISNTLNLLINQQQNSVDIQNMTIPWESLETMRIVACGTSYYAGMIAKYWFEEHAKLSVEVDIASEFRYREPPFSKQGLSVFISQSGETIDTLTGLSLALQNNQETLAIVNVEESSMARQAKHVIYTQACPEIGVASTKAFTAQLIVLACLAIQAGRKRGHVSAEKEQELVKSLVELPAHILSILHQEDKIQVLCEDLKDVRDVLFLGRGTSYPVALEGALKLKEISYIHAEGYPAGELKHGPIALIDKHLPVVVIAPEDRWLEKTISNMQEVSARGGKIICLTDKKGEQLVKEGTQNIRIFSMPSVHSFTTPILYTVPLQLLSYYTALLRGTDVDQPRNLAKSVTVE